MFAEWAEKQVVNISKPWRSVNYGYEWLTHIVASRKQRNWEHRSLIKGIAHCLTVDKTTDIGVCEQLVILARPAGARKTISSA